MLVFLFCILLFLLLTVLPIRVGVRSHVDFFDNDGFVSVYIFGIRIMRARIHFEHDESEHNNSLVVNHGKKNDKIHLNADPKDKKSIAAMINHPAFKGILIRELDAHFTVGKAGDAFFTTLLLSGIRTVFYAAGAFLKCRQNVVIRESFTPVYSGDKLEGDFSGIINVSIANIIYSYISGKAKQKKQEEL